MPRIVPVQRTWTDGEIVTAEMLNANIRDGIAFGSTCPAYIGRQTAAQNIGNAAWTPVTYDAVDLDNYTGHTGTRYTAPLPGIYRISGQVDFVPNGTGYRAARIQINGGTQIIAKAQYAACANNDTALSVSGDVILAAGDYSEIAAYQTSGAGLATGAFDGQPRMTVMWQHI